MDDNILAPGQGATEDSMTARRHFLSWSPTLIGTVAGVRFYEHPIDGDESPLLAVMPDGRLADTGEYDLPEADQVEADYYENHTWTHGAAPAKVAGSAAASDTQGE